MDIKVSIIVPILNVKDFIGECIESIRMQTFEEFEILAIDGGSTDGSLEVLESFRQKEPRLHILHSEKKSYGYQVNMGIEKAVGDYIAIVESDDVVNTTGLERLYEQAVKHDLDYVKAEFEIFITAKNNRKVFHPMRFFKNVPEDLYNIVIKPTDYPDLISRDRYLWKGIYKREFLNNAKIRLNETKGAAYQDQGFLFQTLLYAKRAMYIDSFYYRYRRDNEGSSIYNPKGLQYVSEEYTYAEQFFAGAYHTYLPYFYGTLIDMTKTRYRYYALAGREVTGYEEQEARIKQMLIDGVKESWFEKTEWTAPKEEIASLYIRDKKEFEREIGSEVLSWRKEWNNLYQKINEYNELVICSAGEYGDFLYMMLCKRGFEGKIIVADRMKGVIGEERNGRVLIDMDQATKQYREALFVVANKNYSDEITNELRCLGVKEEQIENYSLGSIQLLLNL